MFLRILFIFIEMLFVEVTAFCQSQGKSFSGNHFPSGFQTNTGFRSEKSPKKHFLFNFLQPPIK